MAQEGGKSLDSPRILSRVLPHAPISIVRGNLLPLWVVSTMYAIISLTFK